MNKNIPLHFQEIIFSSSNPEISRAISKLENEGSIKKIASRVYTSNLLEEPSAIISRNIFRILGHLYPGILLSHRSALEFKPTSSGDIFLTYTYERKISLPGVTVNLLKGPNAIDGDYLFSEGLNVS